MSGSRPRPHDRATLKRLFPALLAGVLLASLDQSLISTELPTIVGQLGGLREQVWASTSYLLATTVALPTVGKLGDAFGRRGLFLAAVCVFVVASTGCALAPTFTVFVSCRAVQGLGAGGILVLAQAIVAELVSAENRSRYLAPLGAMFGLATIAGPLLGGWFIDHLDWRSSFLINVPVGVIVLVTGAVLLRLPPRPHHRHVDFAGMGLLAAAVSSLIIAADSGGSGPGWFAIPTLLWETGSLIGWVGLVFVERVARNPVIPISLLRSRSFVVATCIGAIAGVGMFALIGLLPTYLQFSRGASATESGLLLVPIMGGLVATSLCSGVLISRTGRVGFYPAAGAAIVGTAFVLLANSVLFAPLSVIELDLFVLGGGLGLIVQNIVTIAQNSASVQDLGSATGLTTTAREIGGAVGASVFGSVYASRVFDGLSATFHRAGASVQEAAQQASRLHPQLLHSLPTGVRADIVAVYAHSLQPVIESFIPFAVAAVILAAFLPHPAAAVVAAALEPPQTAEGTAAPGSDPIAR